MTDTDNTNEKNGTNAALFQLSVQDEWEEPNNAGTLDFTRKVTLVLCAQATALACNDLAE